MHTHTDIHQPLFKVGKRLITCVTKKEHILRGCRAITAARAHDLHAAPLYHQK